MLELLDGSGVLLGADGNLCREGTRLKRKSSSSKRGGGAGATDGSGVLLGADGNLCREGTRLKRKSSSSERGGGAGATGRDRSASRSRWQPLQGRDQTQEEELIL